MTSLAQIVAALSVTYNDSGVAMWLASRNSGLGGAAPVDVIARDPLDGLRRVADLVSEIGDADPALFTMREDGEEHPEDTVRRNAQAIVRAEVLAKHQLADILPGGVLCTCGAELAALNPPFDDGAVKGEPLALAVHQLAAR